MVLGWLLALFALSGLIYDLRQATIDPVEAALQQAVGDLAYISIPESEDQKAPDQDPLTPVQLTLAVEEGQADIPEGTDEPVEGGASNEIPAVEKPATMQAPAEPEVPIRLVIPAIRLDAPILVAERQVIQLSGEEYLQWKVPEQYSAGWHENSAMLGQVGNTVLNGHNNRYGEVFAHLEDLNAGDVIRVYSEQNIYEYIIANKMILPEKYEELDIRMNNARWILPSEDERLTLISCWPFNSNTHRLVLVASPVGKQPYSRELQ